MALESVLEDICTHEVAYFGWVAAKNACLTHVCSKKEKGGGRMLFYGVDVFHEKDQQNLQIIYYCTVM